MGQRENTPKRVWPTDPGQCFQRVFFSEDSMAWKLTYWWLHNGRKNLAAEGCIWLRCLQHVRIGRIGTRFAGSASGPPWLSPVDVKEDGLGCVVLKVTSHWNMYNTPKAPFRSGPGKYREEDVLAFMDIKATEENTFKPQQHSYSLCVKVRQFLFYIRRRIKVNGIQLTLPLFYASKRKL